MTGKYLIESLAGIQTEVLLASEFKYSASSLDERTLVIFISQSGETADTLKALDVANETSKTLAIVNVREALQPEERIIQFTLKQDLKSGCCN